MIEALVREAACRDGLAIEGTRLQPLVELGIQPGDFLRDRAPFMAPAVDTRRSASVRASARDHVVAYLTVLDDLLRAAGGSYLCGSAPVAAEEDPSDLCERAILNGARRGGVPVEVLHAVALNETGRKAEGRLRPWPWAINRDGKGYWFDSYEEALAFAKQSLAEGRPSFDVGCVQINYRWHGHAFPSLEDMFDPEWTATYAAQFLRTLYEERGSWSEAAGAYHSLTPEKAMTYRARFDRLLAELEPGALTGAEALVAAARPQARFSSRQARREAQRRAMAERIRAATPAPAAPGGIAGIFVPAAGALVSQGTPLLAPGQPLLSGPPGGLF